MIDITVAGKQGAENYEFKNAEAIQIANNTTEVLYRIYEEDNGDLALVKISKSLIDRLQVIPESSNKIIIR